MNTAPHASGETPDTLPALLEGLERHLSAQGDRDIAAIQAHVRGIETFTDVTSPVLQHEADAAMTSASARRALADSRLTQLAILTSQSSPAWEAVGR